jgi:hypothetical protein
MNRYVCALSMVVFAVAAGFALDEMIGTAGIIFHAPLCLLIGYKVLPWIATTERL